MIVLVMRRGEISSDRLPLFADFISAIPRDLKRIIRPTLEAQAEVFGVEVRDLPKSNRVAQLGYRLPDGSMLPFEGEILTDGDSLCVVELRKSTMSLRQQSVIFADHGTREHPGEASYVLNVSYIGSNPEWPHFAAIQNLAGDILGVSFDTFRYESHSFEKLKEEAGEHLDEPDEDEKQGAHALRDRHARSLAIAIKSSGGLLVRDLVRQLPPDVRERTEELQQCLRSAQLVEVEVVVVCAKSQSQTARAGSRELVLEMSGRGMRCACGRPIAEERIEEALTLTELGRRLLDKSRWLTVLVVGELQQVGVPLDDILIEHQMGGDEVDCVANISGELVLFELKDKEFNLGSAYSFGAKIGIIRPDYSAIISTDKVGNDAKEHFRRAGVARGVPGRYRGGGSNLNEIQYIEGVNNIASGIQRIAGTIYLSDARRIIDGVLPLASLDGIGLLRLFEHKMGGESGKRMMEEGLSQLENSADEEIPF